MHEDRSVLGDDNKYHFTYKITKKFQLIITYEDDERFKTGEIVTTSMQYIKHDTPYDTLTKYLNYE